MRGFLLLLGSLTALGQFAISVYLPSLPGIAVHFEQGAGAVQLTLSAYLFGLAGGQLFLGPLADHYGRRPVMLVALIVYVVASLFCAAAPSLPWLIAGRGVLGAAAAGGQVITRAIVRDCFEGVAAAQAMSWIALAMSVSPAIGPVLGGYLQGWFGWQANFLLLAMAGAGALCSSWLFLPETLGRGGRSSGMTAAEAKPKAKEQAKQGVRPAVLVRRYVELLADGTYLQHVFSVGFLFSGMLAYLGGAPALFMDRLGLSSEAFGPLAIFTVVGYGLGAVTTQSFSRRLGLRSMAITGTALSAMGGGLLLAVSLLGAIGMISVLAPMTLYMFGLGLAVPNAQVAALSRYPHQAGTASALMGFLQLMTSAIGTVVLSALQDTTPHALAVTVAFFGTAGLLVALLSMRSPATADPSPL